MKSRRHRLLRPPGPSERGGDCPLRLQHIAILDHHEASLRGRGLPLALQNIATGIPGLLQPVEDACFVFAFQEGEKLLQVGDAVAQGGMHGGGVGFDDIGPHGGAAGADSCGVAEPGGGQETEVCHGDAALGCRAGAESGHDVWHVGNACHGPVVLPGGHFAGNAAERLPKRG